jgi:hypothetical protein
MKRAALAVVSLVLLCGPRAEPAEKSVGLTILNSMERIGQGQPPFGKPAAELFAAKNEVESFQVVVAALKGRIQVVEAGISDLVGDRGARIGKDNASLFREEYVRVRMSTYGAELPPGLYADPLVPFVNPLTGKPIEPRSMYQERWGEPMVTRGHDMVALPFEVWEGQNQPLWVDLRVPKDAAAGTYRGTFRVVVRDGPAVEAPVTLTVWDFAIPDGPTHRNHFGSFSSVARWFNVKPGSEKAREIEDRYCRAMAEHRINPPIPRRLLPEVKPDGSLAVVPERHKALEKFIAELHVTDFDVPTAPFARLPHSTLRADYKQIAPEQRERAQRYYREFYDYLKRNGWEKRAYVYLLDEPNMRENMEDYEYFTLLEQRVGDDAVKKIIGRIAPNWWDYSWAPEAILAARREIAEQIAKTAGK